MIKITQRRLILSVADRWHKQYQCYGQDRSKAEIWIKLDALDKSTASVEDVAAIIGNYSWCKLKCDECQNEVGSVVRLGEEPDYESNTANICTECLRKACEL
jgi:hypothetical protein